MFENRYLDQARFWLRRKTKKTRSLESAALNSHLNPTTKPIVACILGDSASREERAVNEKYLDEVSCGGEYIDYFGSPESLESQGIENGGYLTYAISQVSKTNKFSSAYLDCTGLIVVGRSKEGQENVSFLTHQDPRHFVYGKKNVRGNFDRVLRERLKQIHELCEPGTIDAVIVGGNMSSRFFNREGGKTAQYFSSIDKLGNVVSNVLGFEPVCIMPPNQILGGVHVSFNTENRRLYMVKTYPIAESRSFKPSEAWDLRPGWHIRPTELRDWIKATQAELLLRKKDLDESN